MANNGFIWMIVGVAAILLWSNGAFDAFIGGEDGGDDANIGPADLKTTITLNTKDALATSATDAKVSYSVFNGDGSYLKDGTTTTGTGSFTVPWDGDYTILAWKAGTTSGY